MRYFIWVMLAFSFGMPGTAAGQDRTWNAPRLGDDRLDWCMGIARECGAAPALEYCKRKRFDGVAAFDPERVGRRATTRTIGTNQTCSNSDGCTAFRYITCTGRVESFRIHNNPVLNGRRLDACMRSASTVCGQPVADEFCRRKRFSRASHFRPDEDRGNSPTQLLSGQQCERTCRGFQQIICAY